MRAASLLSLSHRLATQTTHVGCLSSSVVGRSASLWRLSRRGVSRSCSAWQVELQMPALSPTMEKGNIVSWKKRVGDKLRAGDVVCVIETDKATIDWEATEDGYLAAILAPDNSQDITVGTPVAIIVDTEKEAANYKHTPAAAAPPPPPPAAAPAAHAAPAAPAAASKSYPPHIDVSMPALSPTMEKGTLLQWKKAVGDAVKPGDLLCIIETDKATIDFEASESGYLAAILVPDNTNNVTVGTIVGVLAEDKASVAAFADYVAQASAPPAAAPPAATPAATPAAAPVAPAATPAATAVQSDGRVFASPRARAIAADKGFDIRAIPGTGPNNRVIQADVLNFTPQATTTTTTTTTTTAAAAAPTATPVAQPPASLSAAFTDIPHTNIRKIIAERLTYSKQTIPHYYLQSDINVDELLALRAEMNESAKGAFKLSVNDFVVKAAAIALRQAPEVNSQWTDTAIRRFHTVDINVAVATDQGLLTPLVRNADNIGLVAISQRVRDLAQAAKERKINPNDLAPGTFTISNLGMFGISSFSAVINPPQACILAVGGTEKRVVLDESKPGPEQAFKVVNVMTVTLSCDHRVVDGAVGAMWLQKFKSLVERPTNMLLY